MKNQKTLIVRKRSISSRMPGNASVNKTKAKFTDGATTMDWTVV